MLFYVLMFFQLILIGISFFFWFQYNQEVSYDTTSSSKQIKEKPIKSSKIKQPVKKEKNSHSFKNKTGKSKKTPAIEEEEDTISWDEFNIVERDKTSKEEQKEMDDMFGFGTKDIEPTKNKQKDLFSNEKPKKRTLEEEFGELFDEDEKKELDDINFTPSNGTKKTDDFDDVIDDFSDFDNFQLGDEESVDKEIENDDDAYDFLKQYDFKAEDKEQIDDSIFEKARNNKKVSPNKEIDFDFDFDEDDSHSAKKEPASSKNKPTSENNGDDDIFERLQRLSNMMDQDKK